MDGDITCKRMVQILPGTQERTINAIDEHYQELGTQEITDKYEHYYQANKETPIDTYIDACIKRQAASS